jgi:hypothetical protein
MDSDSWDVLADAAQWSPEVATIPTQVFVVLERSARIVAGWVLLGTLLSNEHNLVVHAYADGAGQSVQMVVFVWLWVPCLLKLLNATWPTSEFTYARDKKCELTMRVLPSAMMLALGAAGVLYWVFDCTNPSVKHHLTVWRSFCGTLVACGLLESACNMYAAKKIKQHTPMMCIMIRAAALSLFPMYASYYDRVPRSRHTNSPSAYLLFMMLLTGSFLFAYEIAVSWHVLKASWSTKSPNPVKGMRALSRGLWAIAFAWFVFQCAVTYQVNHDALRDDCDSHGLAAAIRYADYDLVPERLHLCKTKCDSGVLGTDDCQGDEHALCCNHVTSVFSFGESFIVREGFIILLILYCVVFALFDLIVELYTLCNPGNGYSQVPTAQTKSAQA